MREAVVSHSRNPVEAALWDDFARTIHYQQGDFKDPAAYARLAARLDQIDAAAAAGAIGSSTSPRRPRPTRTSWRTSPRPA